jgi:polyisoprenoid-binding protein YceI
MRQWLERYGVSSVMAMALTGGAVDVAAQTTTRWVVTETGNEARYLVREQLAGVEFPNDAVGRTTAVTGAIVFGPDGGVDAEASRIDIDLTTLQSDEGRRDNYLRRNTLGTAEHPSAVFVPTAVHGLPMPVPATGEATFEIVGDLTIRGTTRPVTWTATATFDGARITGLAKTSFTFDEMGLMKPSVARVLSVVDEIRLEYDFGLVVER